MLSIAANRLYILIFTAQRGGRHVVYIAGDSFCGGEFAAANLMRSRWRVNMILTGNDDCS